jgi:Uma2 family endonuclease
MSTIATMPPPAPARGDHRTVHRGVGWDVYRALSEAQGEGDHFRLAYDGKDLEIVTTSNLHETLKGLAGRFIDAVTTWAKIPHVSCGEATLDAAGAERGLQADQSYCFYPDKVRTAREALARRSMDPADYPAPDLAVEVDVSPSRIDRPGIYAALLVAEVWRIKRDGRVTIEHLQADGSYAPAESSRFLPVTADEVTAWLGAEDACRDEIWNFRLQRWAMGRFDGG